MIPIKDFPSDSCCALGRRLFRRRHHTDPVLYGGAEYPCGSVRGISAAPVILVGFIQYKGMPLIDALREWVRLTDQPVMVYEAHENHYDYDENADIEERHYERTHKKHKKRTEKEAKRKKRFRRNGGY